MFIYMICVYIYIYIYIYVYIHTHVYTCLLHTTNEPNTMIKQTRALPFEALGTRRVRQLPGAPVKRESVIIICMIYNNTLSNNTHKD